MSSSALAAAVVLAAMAAGGWWWVVGRGPALPAPGAPAYADVTAAFYHGLAALEVGLLDDAREQFGRATTIVPEEPAAWANLALTHLRLGEVEAAAPSMAKALALAPDNRELVFLAARMEGAGGRVDEAIALLRRAVALDGTGLRTRFALAEEIERSGTQGADAEAQGLVEELLARAPGNLAVLLERTRLAAKLGDAARLRESAGALARLSVGWPEPALQQLQGLQAAAAAGSMPDATRSTVLLRNVLARVPAFAESLALVRTPAELIGEPVPSFLALVPARAAPDPADLALTYSTQAIEDATASAVFGVSLDGRAPPSPFATDGAVVRRTGVSGTGMAVPGGVVGRAAGAAAVAAVDWDHDFLADVAVAGPGGVRLFRQEPAGQFAEATPRVAEGPGVGCDCVGVWAADVEMDGDVDLVLAARDGATVVARNNADGTWRALPVFGAVSAARAFVWADLDGDADPDAAFLDAAGRVHVFINGQAGQFARMDGPASRQRAIALTVADADADGSFDLLTLSESGAIRRAAWNGRAWGQVDVAAWDGLGLAEPGSYRLFSGDLDNNGATDLVASGPGGTRIWMAGQAFEWTALPAAPAGEVFGVADVDGDGRLDLLGLLSGRPVTLLARGRIDYHWKAFSTRGQQNAGDQRINSFGVGGTIEVRAGLLWQRQVVTGAPVHVGLGTRSTIDVARIVWPNGVPQAEFGVGVNDVLAAEQRLKGSCPWVFADDGHGLQFVTDFLWRSPLGLRINAQDTAGVVQTEDWVRIRGDQLAPRDGAYDVRITAELWETHFFDHVSLQVVDHPAGTEVFIDERFSASRPPSFAIRTFAAPEPVSAAWDDRGRDVAGDVMARDGRYLASFDRGAYQGIAAQHFVELAVPSDAVRRGLTLIAQGWVYPTDSSINVAIGQGSAVRPSGMALEASGPDGAWRVVDPDIGFPAGKDKTMLIDLSGIGQATRVRLRTNLEVYWDWLALAAPAQTEVGTTRLPIATADLRYRGFSRTTSARGDAPERPTYDRLANTSPRWRDLEGYYTRFGDVRELLTAVDDRYVIMNAGDELRLRFVAQPMARAGWRRDFVLVGDGWEKDGDYNTGHSQTVLPLPAHSRPDYGSLASAGALEDDPVFQRHKADWETFHTRYVRPTAFVEGLRALGAERRR